MNNKKLIKIYEDYTDRLNSDVWSSVKTDLFEPKEQFRDKNYFSRMTKKEFIEYIQEQIRAEWENEQRTLQAKMAFKR